MKYFIIILTFLLLNNLKGQTLSYYDVMGNKITIMNDTIKLPTPVAKQIIKDLISGDSAKDELKLTQEQLLLTEKQSFIKDNIINDYVKSGLLYEQRLSNEQDKFKVFGLYTKKIEKQNKKLKTKLLFTKIIGGVIVGGLTYLYITK